MWIVRWIYTLPLRIRSLFSRRRMERELEDEIFEHIERQTAQNIALGMSPLEARASARRGFGNREVVRGAARDTWGWVWLEQIALDFRYATRRHRLAPVSSVVVVLSLAIAIGAATEIFGIVNAMFLRRLPLAHAEQLAVPRRDGRAVSVRRAHFDELRSAPGVPALAGYRFEGVAASAGGEAENLWVDMVTGGYFPLLGARPLLGRVLSEADERGAAPVAVISAGFWARHFGSRLDVIGQALTLDELSFTVVGVMPAEFNGIHFGRQFEIAVPSTLSPAGFADVDRLALTLIARLNSDRSAAGQEAALNAALRRCCVDAVSGFTESAARARGDVHMFSADDPPGRAQGVLFGGSSDSGAQVVLADASHGLAWNADYREDYRLVITAIVAGVALLVVTACANVATLLVARADAREREFAVRAALGASGTRLAAQLLAEGLQLAFAGAALGILIARWAGSVLQQNVPPDAARLGEMIPRWPNGAMLAFTIVLTLLCTLAVSAWPARHAGRTDLATAAAGGARHAFIGWTVERSLIVGQVALSLVLVCCATLFVSTVHNLTRFDGGYRTRNILLAEIDERECTSRLILDQQRCFFADRSAARLAMFDALRRQLTGMPGVTNVALTSGAPLALDILMSTRMTLAGGDTASPVFARYSLVTAGFFASTGVGMVAGRDVEESDVPNGEPVAVVSQAFARHYFPARSAIGELLLLKDQGRTLPVRIVGIARDANYDRFGRTRDAVRDVEHEIIYRPLAQVPAVPSRLTLVVRTLGNPFGVVPALQARLEQSPGLVLVKLTSVGRVLDGATVKERFAATLATSFGVVAVLLAAIGLFGVLSHHVTRRTREIGVRMAMGARQQDVFRLILRQTLVMCAAGLACGIPLALAAARASRTLLFGVGFADAGALLGTSLLLVTVALAATVVPGRRAARVDPLIALRSE